MVGKIVQRSVAVTTVTINAAALVGAEYEITAVLLNRKAKAAQKSSLDQKSQTQNKEEKVQVEREYYDTHLLKLIQGEEDSLSELFKSKITGPGLNSLEGLKLAEDEKIQGRSQLNQLVKNHLRPQLIKKFNLKSLKKEDQSKNEGTADTKIRTQLTQWFQSNKISRFSDLSKKKKNFWTDFKEEYEKAEARSVGAPLTCCLSQMKFEYPLINKHGKTYEGQYIIKWHVEQKKKSDPQTRQECTMKDYQEDKVLLFVMQETGLLSAADAKKAKDQFMMQQRKFATRTVQQISASTNTNVYGDVSAPRGSRFSRGPRGSDSEGGQNLSYANVDSTVSSNQWVIPKEVYQRLNLGAILLCLLALVFLIPAFHGDVWAAYAAQIMLLVACIWFWGRSYFSTEFLVIQ